MKPYNKPLITVTALLTLATILFSCRAEETVTEPEPNIYYFEDGVTPETEAEAPEPEPDVHYEYSNDFSKPIAGNDPDWTINEMADISVGYLTARGGQHPYFALKHRANADVVTLTVDLKANRPGAMPHDSGYIALRLPKYDDQFAAVGQNGIWLAFQCRKVGIINGWPGVTLYNSDFDFSKARTVTVEDDQKANIISVYVDEDGEKTLVFRVAITDSKNVTVTDQNGEEKITAKFGYDIPASGYVAVWAHGNNGQVTFDNLKVSWDHKAPAVYVPTDPSTLTDLYSDTWVAADDMGRIVTDGAADVKDKLIGMFYQIWHVSTSTTYPDQILYDHHALYQQGGHAAVKDAYTKGPVGWGHYWGQPYFGYYLTNDQWVIRKHASMLCDIGIDFIYLDVTNGDPLTTSYMAIFKEYKAMREEGMDTPEICFFLGDTPEPKSRVFEDIWENIYSSDQYSDLYVMYKGKPLIIANLTRTENKKAVEKFTVRRCWALRENIGGQENTWSWMYETPQKLAFDPETGELEQISISAAILANTSSGRSNVRGRQPKLITLPDGTLDMFQFELPTTGEGLFFAEQMEQAAEHDPYVVLINAWNEWTAGRWEGTLYPKIANTNINWTYDYYVDCFNPEFSRDIEPMAGGFGDNYYYQLAQFLRTYKGSRAAPEAAGQTEMALDAPLSAWDSVWPEYMDTAGDTFHRDAVGFGSFFHYTNDTGRNDIISAKVSRTDESTYFLAVCNDTITAPEGENWMNLFINTDCNYETGWYGYDIVINRDGAKAAKGKVTIEKFVDNGWRFESVGEGEIKINGNYLVIKADTALCGLTGDFDFKWADNSTTEGEIMQFLDLGDAAPNARFNYAYRAEQGENTFGGALESYLAGGAAFSAGKSYMAAEGGVYRLYDGSTNAKAKMHEGRLFAPVTALGNLKDSAVTVASDGRSATWTFNGKTVVFTADSADVKVGYDICVIPVAPFIENGVLYIPLNAAAYVAELNYYASGTSAILSPKSEAPEGESGRQLFEVLNRSF